MRRRTPPPWRSLLYVPAHVDRFVQRAHERGADAIILDLEDGVPPERKEEAREKAARAVPELAAAGVDLLVRINASPRSAVRDLERVVGMGLKAVVVPKVRGAAQLRLLSEVLDELEGERGVPPGTVGIVALIESIAALEQVFDIAASTGRVDALILGAEDFAAEAGVAPGSEGMLYAYSRIVLAARASGALPLGLFGSIADYSDLERYRERALRSRAMGFGGATCIHPSQVPVLNDVFAPSADEAAWAARVVAAFEQAVAAGRGAVEVDGWMVDAPVAARARRLLELRRRLEGRRRRPEAAH